MSSDLNYQNFAHTIGKPGRFPQAVYSVNTPKGRQQPTDIFTQGADLRERSDQLLQRLKRLLEESEQRRNTVNTRLDELIEQWHSDILSHKTSPSICR
jgi:hypothetical protein